MKKNLLFMIFSFALGSGQIFAQNLSGETEVGTDGKGEGFFSQYILFDTKHANVLTRYFYVNQVLRRGEFCVGPTMNLNNSNLLKLQFGGTTDQEVMVASTLIVKIEERDVIYIADGKISTQEGPSTFYQKLFVPLVKSGRWQFRIEHLQVAYEQSFLRVGIEYQQKLPDKNHLFIAPFYDPIRKSIGGQFGVRFF